MRDAQVHRETAWWSHRLAYFPFPPHRTTVGKESADVVTAFTLIPWPLPNVLVVSHHRELNVQSQFLLGL
jgi:hypothetical protein